jgi:branched-chain amino acid transport system permease protein
LLPFWAAAPIAALVGAATGMIVCLPALRLSRFYLAIVTLAFGELLRWGYIHSDQWTGGSTGLAVTEPSFFGRPLDSGASQYFILLFAVVLLYWMTWNLLRSRFGRAMAGVRLNEAAAASLGISRRRVKLIAFGWSGLLVGAAGALFAIVVGRISPASFDLSQLLLHFSIVAVGGFGSLLGSFLGAALLTAAPELLRNVPGAEEILFSVILILVMLFLPRGLGGLVVDYIPALKDRFFRT